ncbi:fibronectin type III domain-containing protein, partial [Candidatus Synechococcus spongiarum]|uniref:fibronectin type III domain-containing protein n=1 Tax=Candidatus Synechococcus spongiarum TaxID=431041 RepID=UPI000471EBE4
MATPAPAPGRGDGFQRSAAYLDAAAHRVGRGLWGVAASALLGLGPAPILVPVVLSLPLLVSPARHSTAPQLLLALAADSIGLLLGDQQPAQAQGGAAEFSLTGTPSLGQTLTISKTKDDPDGNGAFSYFWQFRATPSEHWSPAAARNRGCANDALTCTPVHTTTHPTIGGEFRVRVFYTDGIGQGHTVDTNTIGPITPDAAPTGLTAVAGPGSGEVTLEWDNPGNRYISKYQVRQGTGTTVTWGSWTDFTSTGATTSHTVTGLTNGTAYSFQVRAVVVWSGKTQNGTASATVTATPVASPPPVMSLREPSVEGVMRVDNKLLLPESAHRSGSEFSYSISSNVAVGAGVFVCIEVSESGGDRLAAGAGREGIGIAGFSNGTMALAPTLGTWTNNTTNERPSRITIRLLPPTDSRCSVIGAAGYVVNPRGEDNTFSFIIADDDDLSVGLSSADATMIEGVGSQSASVTVTLGRRLYAGESAEVVLDLSSSTGAMLPDGDAMTKDDFVVTAAGTGVTGEDLDSSRLTLTFEGHDTDTVRTATLTFTPTDRDDGDTDDDTVTVALNTSNS